MFLHQYTLAVARKNGLDIQACTEDIYGDERLQMPELYEVQTFYERMFLEQGYKITYLRFGISHEGAYQYPEDPAEFDSKAWREAEGPRRSFGHQG